MNWKYQKVENFWIPQGRRSKRFTVIYTWIRCTFSNQNQHLHDWEETAETAENTFLLSARTWMKKTVSYWLQMILNHKTMTKTLRHFVSSYLLLFNYLSSSVENVTAASISLSSGRCHLLPVAIGNDYPKTPLINVFLHFMNEKLYFF